MKDFYKILEVSRHAKSDEIKKSYRRLAFKYHPDTNNGSKHLEGKFKQLAEAYGVLSDPKGRKQHDIDLRKPIQKSTTNSQTRNKQAKQQQPLSPTDYLNYIKDINKYLSNFDKSIIDKVNLFDTLNKFLLDENINFLLSRDDKKINHHIITEVLNCCQNFDVEMNPRIGSFYIQQIAGKLTRLAGDDKKTTQRILKFAKQRKYNIFKNEYWGFIAVLFLFIIIILFIIIATYKNN